MKWPDPKQATFPRKNKNKTMFSDKAPRKSCLSLQHFHSPSPDCSPAAMKRISGFFGDWDGLLYDGKSGLFRTKYQNVFMNNHIKVHASKCLQFGFFQSLIMIITSIAWKRNVGSLVMSLHHASSASCSWITAKGTEKMSIERDSAWRVKCYSAK